VGWVAPLRFGEESWLSLLVGWFSLAVLAAFLLLAALVAVFGCLFVLYKLGGLPRLLTPGGRLQGPELTPIR